MIPREPNRDNIYLRLGIAAGQERVLALSLSHHLHYKVGHYDPDSVVQTAEKYHAFLTRDGGSGEPGAVE